MSLSLRGLAVTGREKTLTIESVVVFPEDVHQAVFDCDETDHGKTVCIVCAVAFPDVLHQFRNLDVVFFGHFLSLCLADIGRLDVLRGSYCKRFARK